MADLKFRIGASATVPKGEDSLEKKLAGIMGTTTSNIKSLENQLRREREAEEARKKAEEEARKRAEAAAAANAAARAADGKAKQDLAALLKKGGTAGTVPNTGAKYTAVEFGAEQAKQGVPLTEYTLEQARADREVRERAAAANQAVYDAYSGNSYVDETDPEELEKMQGDAQTRLDVASDAANKNRAYIESQEQKLGSLQNQIRAMQSTLSDADAGTVDQYNELIRQYNVALDLYNQAVKLSGKRQTQFSERLAEYKAIENTIEREERIAQENAIRYSDETGNTMQAQIADLSAQISSLQDQANAYRRAHDPATARIYDDEANALREQLAGLREDYAAWKGEAFAYNMEKTLSSLSAEEIRLLDQLLADSRDVGATAYEFGMTDVFGDYARAESALLATYTPEQIEQLKEYRARQLREEQANMRTEQVRKIVGDSPIAAAGLSVGSVLSNFVSAPLSIADVVFQTITNPTMPLDFNRRAMAAQNLTTDIRTGVVERIDGEFGQMLYSTLMSGLDSVVAAGLPGRIGSAVLGMTAASSTMQDVTERGGTLEQALLGGVAAGVFECFFESFSIGQLKAFDETAVSSMRDFASNILKSVVVNASEEAATEIANVCFDILAMGSVSSYETGIRELMAQGLTESQAKKAMASTLAGQVWDSAVSGALMGLMFGAGGSLYSFKNDAAGIRYAQAYQSALQLPEEYRPEFTYRDGQTTLAQVNEYGKAVYAAMKEYNTIRENDRKLDPGAFTESDAKVEELSGVQVKTVARAEDVLAAEEAGRAAADAEAGVQAAVTAQTTENAPVVSDAGTRENTPVSFDTDDVSAFVAEEAAEIYDSLSLYEGQMLADAVADEARALRGEGREDVAAALEQIYTETGGITYGDSLSQGRERDAGARTGGEARAVAESAGSDQGRNVQAGREETGRTESADYETGRKITLAEIGIRGVAAGQTFSDITDTSRDPEIIEIGNAARLAGVEVHVVTGGAIRMANGATVSGIYQNGVIVIRADDPTFTPTQLYNHELFHAMKENTRGPLTETVGLLQDNLTDEEFDALVDAYQQLYAGLDLDEEGIFEEICADMYAGMIREQYDAARRANLPRLTEEARRIVGERANVTAVGERGANATRAGPAETKTAAGRDAGDGKYVILTSSENEEFVEVDRTLWDGNDIRALPRILSDIVKNKYKDWIDVSGQKIGINQKTAKEWRMSRDSQKLISQASTNYVDKINAFGYADELLKVSRDYINEKKKHTRKDNFEQFARGTVKFRVGDNGYAADIVVGITKRGTAVLYDIVNLIPTKITEASNATTVATNATNRRGEASADASISDPDSYVNPRLSISSDTNEILNSRLEELERDIDDKEALMGTTFDSTLLGAIDEAKAERSAIYDELQSRARRAARQAAREENSERTAVLEELRLVEDHAKELSREASAERAAYKADGNAEHLANVERLREEAAAERKKANGLRESAGITEKKQFRPYESMRQTTNRVLDLFKIQAGRRAEMREGMNVVLNRTLAQGYVTESDLESLLRTMYDAGVDVVQPDAAYEDVAKTVRGTTLYISEDVRREFGEDWREMQRALTRAGVKTSLDRSARGIDSLYAELAEGYPGIFDSEATDLRMMLEGITEAAQLGRAEHRSLAEAAQAEGLSSDEDFAALYGEVSAELRSFADRAGLEVRLRENLLRETNERNAERLKAERERYDKKLSDLRKHYADIARRASERRQRSEQMTKIRNALKRLNRAAERNDQTLTKVVAQQSPEVQQLAERAMSEISTVANRLTDRKLVSLLDLRRVYEDMKANDPNFIPNPATEKALARVGMIHLNEMTVEDLQALYDAVTRIEHDFDEANRIIGEGMDQQLDNAGLELIDEIDFAKGTKARGNMAKWFNENSLSPSRALLRYVGYDRSGVMGRLVESFEKGDIDAMGYTLGADMIFTDFMQRKEVQKWLTTAAGKNAEMIELEVPRILEWGEGDTPIFDQENDEIIKDKVYLTKMMVVNMARDLKNEQNMWHVKYGGYTFPDAKLYKKGDLREAYARSNSKAVRMSPEFVRQVVDEHLDEIGLEYVALLDQYYDVYSKNKVNGVSRQLDGADRAIAASYNPIRTSKAFRAQSYNVFDGTIEGMGSLKNRQYFAGNPLMLSDADETMRWHRDNMSRYVGYAIPMRNFKALMNYSKGFNQETVRAQIEKKFGANAGTFLDNFAKIIEEGKLGESEGFTALDKLTGKYVSRVLGFNLSSMLKQLSALSTAGTSYGFGVVNHALATPSKVNVDLIRKYTPYYDYRGEGNTYVELANYVRNKGDAQQSKALQTLLGKNWLQEMDLWVHRRLWFAAEYAVQRDTNLRPSDNQAEIDAGRDPYYKAVAEVFNRMTHDTQTNYNTMSRPIALRSTNPIVRMFAMFKTDAFQIQGIVREQYGAWQTAKRKHEDGQIDNADYRQAKRRMVNGFVGYMATNVMASMLEMVAKLIRGDDDDYRDENGNPTFGSVSKELVKDTLYGMVGCVLFGDQIADLISAAITGETLWEPDIPSVSSLYDMYESVTGLCEQIGEAVGTFITLKQQGADTKEYWKNNSDLLFGVVRRLLYQVGTFTGLPIQNMEKTVVGLIEHAFPQIPVQYEDLFGDYTKSDLVNLEGDALTAALHAYLTDEVGNLGAEAEAEILRLYELYGNKALPGANAPTKVTETDEDGNEVERKLTFGELGNWDVNYRLTFMDAMGEIIGSETYNALSDAEKLKLIARANEYARDYAKEIAGVGNGLDGWKLDTMNATDEGVPLADAILFSSRASMVESDVDDNGNAIDNSKARKIIEMLDDLPIGDWEKRELLRGELSPTNNKTLDALLNAGYGFDESVKMLHDEFTGKRDVDRLVGYLEDGFDPDSAREIYEVVGDLEPLEGKKEVNNTQIYAAIAGSRAPDEDKWMALSDMVKDTKTGLEDLQAIRAAGGTPEDYAELRSIGQVAAYLRGVEVGLDVNTALRVVNAVASLPDLPEGESYDKYEKIQAAMPTCQTPEQQIKVYAMYQDADQREAEESKIRGAYEAGIDPEIYLDYRIDTKDLNAKDANGETVTNLKKARVTLAIDAMNLTDEQKDYLWLLEYAKSGLNKTPWHTGRTYSSAEEYVRYL